MQPPSKNFNDLSTELIYPIYQFSDFEDKKNLSLVNKTIYQIGARITQSLHIMAPLFTVENEPPKDIPDNVLVNVIQRYPNVRKLTFGLSYCYGGQFELMHNKYLRILIAYLTENQAQHPLSQVKKMVIREIVGQIFTYYHGIIGSRIFSEKKRSELNLSIMESLGHPNLESLVIKAFHNGSTLTGKEVTPILQKSLQLKKFALHCFQADNQFDISFKGHAKLISAKFDHFSGPVSSIESLKSCSGLQTLILKNPDFKIEDGIKQILMSKHSWKLKKLEIEDILIKSDGELDAITKNFPDLEHLCISLSNISEDSLEALGKNCPKLRNLYFNYDKVTNQGIDRLTQHLSELKALSFTQGYQITEEGVASIARNCRQLQVLSMIHIAGIKSSGIEALVLFCQELKVLEISHCGPVALEDLRYLAQNLRKLVDFHMHRINDINDKQIWNLKSEFPHLSKVPLFNKFKKLLN